MQATKDKLLEYAKINNFAYDTSVATTVNTDNNDVVTDYQLWCKQLATDVVPGDWRPWSQVTCLYPCDPNFEFGCAIEMKEAHATNPSACCRCEMCGANIELLHGYDQVAVEWRLLDFYNNIVFNHFLDQAMCNCHEEDRADIETEAHSLWQEFQCYLGRMYQTGGMCSLAVCEMGPLSNTTTITFLKDQDIYLWRKIGHFDDADENGEDDEDDEMQQFASMCSETIASTEEYKVLFELLDEFKKHMGLDEV